MPRITELVGYAIGVGEAEIAAPGGPEPVKVLVFTDQKTGDAYKVYLPEVLREEIATFLATPAGSQVQVATALPPGLRNGR